MFVENLKFNDDNDSINGESQDSPLTTIPENSSFLPFNKQQMIDLNHSVRRNHWNKLPVPRRSTPRRVAPRKAKYYDSMLIPRYDLNQSTGGRTKKRKTMRFFSGILLVTLSCVVLTTVVLEDNPILDFIAGDYSRLLCISGSIRSRLKLSGSFERHRYLCDTDGDESSSSAFAVSESAAVAAGAASMNHKGYKETHHSNGQELVYPPDYLTDLPSGDQNIAVVLTIPSCPEDRSQPTAKDDAGYAFYDAAAILKQSVRDCTTDTMLSQYNSTLYAIIHPDAISCLGQKENNDQEDEEGTYYNRVAMLEELGYSVILWKEPICLDNFPDEHYNCLKKEIQTDDNNGIRDLMRLYAYNFTNHDVAIMINFDTIIKEPIDSLIDEFKSIDTKTAMYSKKDDGTINTGMVLLKPNATEFSAMLHLYQTTPYTCTKNNNDAGGWDETGIKGMGADGFLTYYYYLQNKNNHNNTDSDNLFEHSASFYSSITSATMKTAKVLSFASHSTCGKPWECHYDNSWDSETEDKCRILHQSWFAYRKEFELHWNKENAISTDNQFHMDFFLGYCPAEGEYPRASDYYSHNNTISMITPVATGLGMVPRNAPKMAPKKRKSFTCDDNVDIDNTQTNSVTNSRNQHLSLTTSRTIIMDEDANIAKVHSCVSGSITDIGYEAPINLLFVIDRSEDAREVLPGMLMGDLNNDGLINSILDAQIAIIMKTLETIRDSNGYLNNNNVMIGLVTYSTVGEYHGMFPPMDPKNPSQINPHLLKRLQSMIIEGWCNFGDALDKAIDFFENDAPRKGRNNIMYFFAAGLPHEEAETISFRSEMLILDARSVKRYGIGLGIQSDIRPDYGLAKIDNTLQFDGTSGAEKVYTYAALQKAVFSSSGTFHLKNFALYVKNDRDNSITMSKGVVVGPLGYIFHNHIITSTAGVNTDITVRVEVTLDEIDDDNKMAIENMITTKHPDIGTSIITTLHSVNVVETMK